MMDKPEQLAAVQIEHGKNCLINRKYMMRDMSEIGPRCRERRLIPLQMRDCGAQRCQKQRHCGRLLLVLDVEDDIADQFLHCHVLELIVMIDGVQHADQHGFYKQVALKHGKNSAPVCFCKQNQDVRLV